jgi:palmitoyltransferase
MTLAIYIAGLCPSPSNFPTKELMRCLGPPLILLFYGLKFFVTFTYFYQVLPYYSSHAAFSLFSTLFGLFLLYCLLYNYTKCVLTGPGHPSGSHEPLCKKCNTFKPLRAHHCSICNTCVLKMDHHCPWIHNCLGLYNHCYFLLFLFYLVIGCFFFTFLSFPVYLYTPKSVLLTMSLCLCGIFAVVILCFGAWHWYLALRGTTTIEYFGEKQSFTSGSWRKNLEVVFGTMRLTTILLPTHKQLTLDGRSWPDTLHGV